MENFILVKQGEKYSLIENALHIRAFVLNEVVASIQKDVAALPSIKRGSWARNFTVISLDGKIREIDRKTPSETVKFTVSDVSLKFEGTEYPIALDVEPLQLTGLSPVATFRCNDSTSKYKNWKLPTSDFFQTLKRKFNATDTDALGLVFNCDAYLVFTKEAADFVQPFYDEEINRLNESHQQWLSSLVCKVGDTVLGVKITDIKRNPNGSASYWLENEGQLHENSIEDFMEMELPEYVQKVSFDIYGHISYFYSNTWNDNIDNFTDSF